jgi:hypothetical protein
MKQVCRFQITDVQMAGPRKIEYLFIFRPLNNNLIIYVKD